MGTPYFCTKCGRQHVRGAIYTEHDAFKEHDPKTCKCTDCHPIKVEIIQKEIDAAAIPDDVKPVVVSAKDGGTIERWEPAFHGFSVLHVDTGDEMAARKTFQKTSPCVDRVVESMMPPALPKQVHGAPVKKPWWQRKF